MNKDLISRQDAIKEVSKYVHSVDMIIGNGTLSMAGCMDVAEEILEGLPSIESEPKWIPCSERLPEYNESVLTWDGYVFCIEKRIPYIRDDDGEPIEGDWWVGDEYDDYESECYTNLRDGAAIAWLSLPEPCKGGDAE